MHLLRSLVLALLLAAVAAWPAWADQAWKRGTPRASETAENDVPLEAAARIAREKAVRKWGRVSPGPVFPMTDSRGELSARLFVFRIDGGGFDDPEEILERLTRAGERLSAKVRNAGTGFPSGRRVPVHRSLDRGKARSASAASRAPETLTMPEPVQDGFPLDDPDLKERWGIGRYGSVVVSARTSLVPVPQVIHGLPPVFVQWKEMTELCAKQGTSNVTLERIHYRSPAGQIFMLKDDRGRTFQVDAQRMRLVTKTEDSRRRTKIQDPEGEARKAREANRKEWQRHGLPR